MASIWCITCWHCFWSSELPPSPQGEGLVSPTPFWDPSGVADFGFFAWGLAWTSQACVGVLSAIWESPLWPHICAGICTKQKTYHNTLPMADIRTRWGSLTTHSFNPFFWPVTIPLTFHLGSHSLTYFCFTPHHLGRTKCPISTYPSPYRDLSNCTFTHTTKSSSQDADWLRGLTPLIYISTMCTSYWLWHLRRGCVDQWRLQPVKFMKRRSNPLFCLSHWAESS